MSSNVAHSTSYPASRVASMISGSSMTSAGAATTGHSVNAHGSDASVDTLHRSGIHASTVAHPPPPQLHPPPLPPPPLPASSVPSVNQPRSVLRHESNQYYPPQPPPLSHSHRSVAPSARVATTLEAQHAGHHNVHVTHTKSGKFVYHTVSGTSMDSSTGKQSTAMRRKSLVREPAAVAVAATKRLVKTRVSQQPADHPGSPFPLSRRRIVSRHSGIQDIASGSRSVPGRIVDRQRCGGAPIAVRPASHFT